jgi:DNA repair exonuclease SbcCD ATPase subunit
MKLVLTNFRCYGSKTIEIPDTGLILLSGPSGSGKSTILKAILYALFGTKAVRKPYSFGTLSCSVTLEFSGMTIKRTSRPNRLVVNGRYEDDAAQAIVNKAIGMSHDEFLVSSYIPQKNNSSVLSLSQADQLRVLKTLSIHETQNDRHKTIIKEMVTESNRILTEKSAETRFVKGELASKQELTPTPFPIDLVNEETEELAIGRLQDKHAGFNKTVDKLVEKLRENTELLHQYGGQLAAQKTTEERMQEIQEQLDHDTDKMDSLSECLEEDPEVLESRIKEIKKALRYASLREEAVFLREQYEKISGNEQEERQNRRDALERDLWVGESLESSETELRRYAEELRLYTERQEALKKIRRWSDTGGKETIIKGRQTNLKTQRVALTELCKKRDGYVRQETVLQCPDCETNLCLQGDHLVSVTDRVPVDAKEIRATEKKIAVTKSEIERLEEEIVEIKSIRVPGAPKVKVTPKRHEKKITELTKFIAENKQREHELRGIRITEQQQTPALQALSEQLKDIDSMLGDLGVDEPQEDSAALYDVLSKLTQSLEDHTRLTEEHKDLCTKVQKATVTLDRLSDDLDELNEQLHAVDVKRLKEENTDAEDKLRELREEHERDTMLLESVNEYLEYAKHSSDRGRWVKKLEAAEERLSVAEKRHVANLALKDRYTQAELVALETTINSINEHTRYYLDTFFADHQLAARVTTVKKDKNIHTLKITTTINYKGHEYDSVSQLSGGEFDRCTLASICGINSMLSSPLLILDESLSSLDTDTNTEIIRFLSELSQDKLILVCSHEAVRGIFDHIVEI